MVSELFWNLYSEKPTAIIAWKNPNPLLPAMLEASKINPIITIVENQFIETQQNSIKEELPNLHLSYQLNGNNYF